MNKKRFSLYEVAEGVRREGVVVYPTETFWALGGSALSESVSSKVARIKDRPENKPLPVIIGALAHLDRWFNCSREEREIAGMFWPAPLSIILEAGPELAAGTQDEQGRVSVRCPAHKEAALLSVQSGCPLVSTSANSSGMPPSRDFSDLEESVLRDSDYCLYCRQLPAGGLPSTVIRLEEGGKTCRVLRSGALSISRIREKGLECLPFS